MQNGCFCVSCRHHADEEGNKYPDRVSGMGCVANASIVEAFPRVVVTPEKATQTKWGCALLRMEPAGRAGSVTESRLFISRFSAEPETGIFLAASAICIGGGKHGGIRCHFRDGS